MLDNFEKKVYLFRMSFYEWEKESAESTYKKGEWSSIIGLPRVAVISQSPTEASTHIGVNKSHFVTIGGQRLFVKYPLKSEIFTEILISYLAKQCGINCIDCALAIDHDEKTLGIVSPDFGEHVSYGDMGYKISQLPYTTSVDDVVDKVVAKTSVGEDSCQIDAEAVKEQITKITCFDYLTGQTDRHSDNIAFSIKENDGVRTMELAPLYDNARAFLLEDKMVRTFNITPDDTKGINVPQQLLLNGKYKDMKDKFSEMFADENYPKLLEELDSIYGLKNIYTPEEYQAITTRIQNTVKGRIQRCEYRIDPEPYVPMNVMYSCMKRHMQAGEYSTDTEKLKLFWDYKAYYGLGGGAAAAGAYDSFYDEKTSYISKWKYYDEYKEIMQQKDDILEADTKELADKKRKVDCYILKKNIQGIDMSPSFNSHEYWKNILFDDDAIFSKKMAETHYKYSIDAYRCLRDNYSLYEDVRNWCEDQEKRKDELSLREKLDYRRTRKLLNNYVKFANSTIKTCAKDEEIVGPSVDDYTILGR